MRKKRGFRSVLVDVRSGKDRWSRRGESGASEFHCDGAGGEEYPGQSSQHEGVGLRSNQRSEKQSHNDRRGTEGEAEPGARAGVELDRGRVRGRVRGRGRGAG